ncbi:hypothetical protein NP493_52g05007 [Ridgeia piscesae]|uniref:Uncharacterized protein n=1 Tax=Ridgeia piscesae TaxID=27915 RepID=A0AAD9UJ86_RIDPI|nr:hypothetical protein NP493_52g05007 [Ridgeia piscesae]
MSDAILRLLNATEGDEAALERLWNDYEFCTSYNEESDVSDSESETGKITGNGGPVIGGDVVVDTDMPDSDIPAMDFDMRATDVDVAMERAMALPEFVLLEDDDIVKATAFSFHQRKWMDMVEMTPRDQMLMLLGKLSCGINLSEKTCGTHRSQASLKMRERHRTTYMVEGRHICVNTFKFLHAISTNRLAALQKWYRCNGLQPKEKRNGGRANNAFISNYADDHGLHLHGRVPGLKRDDIKLMPSSETRVKVFKAYCMAMHDSEHRSMSETVFRHTWKKLLPFIVTARPMTDLCWTCQKNNVMIYRSVSLTEADKSDRLIQQELQLETVKQERAAYNKMVGSAKDVCRQLGVCELSANTPCSRQIEMHYSFDYVQQIHLPSEPLQPGPIYFLVPRKVGLFGVCCEGLPKRVNFLIDEAHLISKVSKAAFRRHAVSSSVVNGSACSNSAQLVGTEDGTSFVPVGDWQSDLSPFYRPLPGIKGCQHFRFNSAQPGTVFVRETLVSPETTYDMARNDSTVPTAAVPARGMSAQRQWYLYDTVRHFVSDEQKDVLCPLPTVPRVARVAEVTTSSRGKGKGKSSGGPPAKRAR